jgi:hypothetical protein
MFLGGGLGRLPIKLTLGQPGIEQVEDDGKDERRSADK